MKVLVLEQEGNSSGRKVRTQGLALALNKNKMHGTGLSRVKSSRPKIGRNSVRILPGTPAVLTDFSLSFNGQMPG
jgi:hypothetical protein